MSPASSRLTVAAGVAVAGAAWLGPLPGLARHAFAAHMTMHVTVVAVAAPLIALGLAGGGLDPARRWPRLLAAIPASLIELVVVWTWHAPALHHAARQGGTALVLEQGSFLASGVLVWIAAFGGEPRQRAERAPAGVVGLLLTAMHMTLLGALLALAPRPLYGHGAGPWGMSALDDQHLGGALMLAGGGSVYLAGGLALTARLVAARRREASW